jgi:hypothetical protein
VTLKTVIEAIVPVHMFGALDPEEIEMVQPHSVSLFRTLNGIFVQM